MGIFVQNVDEIKLKNFDGVSFPFCPTSHIGINRNRSNDQQRELDGEENGHRLFRKASKNESSLDVGSY